MAEDREKEEIHICVLHVYFILMYCKCANNFSITTVETNKTGDTDADYSMADTLFKQKATRCLWVFLKFYKCETGSYFPKHPTVGSQTYQHKLKHSSVMKYKVQICIYRTTSMVHVNFMVPYTEVKHHSLLAPIF